MSTDIDPGQGNHPEPAESGGEVVSLEAARAARPAPAPDDGERRSAPTAPVLEGEVVRVDQPGDVPGDWLARLAAQARERRPIVHPALRSRAEAAKAVRWITAHYAHVTAYHLTRTPKYGGKLAVRAPRGAARLAGGLLRWAFDLEGHPVRVHTVLAKDPETYLKLARHRDARVRVRVPVAIVTVLVALAVAAVTVVAAPPLARLAVLAAAVGVCGVLGRKPDARPLIDRAVTPVRVEKLTSEIVVRALGALGIAAINQAIAKNPRAAIEFKAPIARDGGAGWRADVGPALRGHGRRR